MAETGSIQEKKLQEEIRELEATLEVKRAALSKEGRSVEEKELFRDMFRERYPELKETPLPSAAPREGAVPAQGASGQVGHAREEEIRQYIEFAFEKGVRAAIGRAKAESPWLLDELHDRLIDEYFQKLMALGIVADES